MSLHLSHEHEDDAAANDDYDVMRSITWTTSQPTKSNISGGTSSPLRSPQRRILACPLWRRTADCTVLQIRQKLASYVHQDQRKGRACAEPVLTVDATLALLEAVQYRCTYCSCTMKRVWRAPRDPQQWTLDRIDNNRAHQIDNVVPSCMQCNLRRRARDHWSFRRGAEIVAGGITKLDERMMPKKRRNKKKKKRQNWDDEWMLVKSG